MSNQPVAIVTGGSRGIGRSIALQLAGDGYAMVINYYRNAAAAEEVVKLIESHQIESQRGRAIAVQADVASSEDRVKLIERTRQEFGRLDLLVNNAGITSPGRKDILETTEESWDQVLGTNLKGPFFLAQAASNWMLELREQGTISRGYLINISSISAYTVSTNRADYCLAKAATGMMTSLFADRLAAAGIFVYEVCPGVIASDMTAPLKEKYDKLIAEGLTPIPRWGEPEDVAKAVAALVSGAFSFSTGQRIDVDGGFHIRRL